MLPHKFRLKDKFLFEHILYGKELWEVNNYLELNKYRIKYFRNLKKVTDKCPTPLVLAERNKTKLEVRAHKRVFGIIKYWNIQIDQSCYIIFIAGINL